MKEMNEQEKQDILMLDEVMTFFLIDECGAIIWRISHDLADGKIEESDQVKADLQQIAHLQTFAVKNLGRFGLKDIDIVEKINDSGDLKKWHTFWHNWRSNLSDAQWEKVSIGEYEEYLPKKKWNEEDS